MFGPVDPCLNPRTDLEATWQRHERTETEQKAFGNFPGFSVLGKLLLNKGRSGNASHTFPKPYQCDWGRTARVERTGWVESAPARGRPALTFVCEGHGGADLASVGLF